MKTEAMAGIRGYVENIDVEIRLAGMQQRSSCCLTN